MYMRWFVVCLLVSNLGSSRDECPVQCRCDIWNGGKRLKCIDKKLASIEIDPPKETNAIDLSHNVIHTVHDHGFQNLHLNDLQYVNLSYNLIGYLSLRAFDGLLKLTYLDLSHNGLQDLPPDIFSTNHKLQTLILTGNKFINIEPKPLIKSSSLQDLLVNRCLIPHIYTETFSDLPSIKRIDLSDNLLIEIERKFFENNPGLSNLNVMKNPLVCNNNKVKDFKYYCLTNVIVFKSRCSEGMMEKIRMDPESTEVSDVYIPWVFQDDTNVTNVSPLDCKTEFSMILPLMIAFFSGAFIGMCNVGLCWCIVWFAAEKQFSYKEPGDLIYLESSFEFQRFDNNL